MNTTAEFPTAHCTPLWHGNQLVGSVDIESCDRGTMTGTLRPGPAFDADRQLFEEAISAEEAIAQSSLREYQAAWRTWRQACRRLEQLELAFGDLHIPIEGFAIDAEWRVEFETALWWDALLSPNHGAARSSSRWR
jgi:GAF domain-containing protein